MSSPTFHRRHGGGALQAARRGETAAPPTPAWPLAFQSCAHSLTFSVAGCRCVLRYRNSLAPGPLSPPSPPLRDAPTSRAPGESARPEGSACSPSPSHSPSRSRAKWGLFPLRLLPQLLLPVCHYRGGGGRRLRPRGAAPWKGSTIQPLTVSPLQGSSG